MPTNYTLSKTYDLSDKDTAYAMECFEHACKLIDKQVTSWDDMYATIGDVYKHFIGSPSPTSAIAATGLMYSFILAMQQMPDEGDILIQIAASGCAHVPSATQDHVFGRQQFDIPERLDALHGPDLFHAVGQDGQLVLAELAQVLVRLADHLHGLVVLAAVSMA